MRSNRSVVRVRAQWSAHCFLQLNGRLVGIKLVQQSKARDLVIPGHHRVLLVYLLLQVDFLLDHLVIVTDGAALAGVGRPQLVQDVFQLFLGFLVTFLVIIYKQELELQQWKDRGAEEYNMEKGLDNHNVTESHKSFIIKS